MEFVPGEVDFREIIHPKRDWREADADFCPNLTTKFLMPNTVFLPNLSIADLLFNMGPESLIVFCEIVLKV